MTYQWYRGDNDQWTEIEGATSRYYKQTDDDFGYYVKVVATGVGEYTDSAEAATTKATMRRIGAASIQGDLYVGKTVTVELTADGAAENATYSWYRGDGENWTKIVDATDATYTLTDDDLGYYLKARAVGKNGYTNSAEAVSDAVVALPSQLDAVTISGSRLVGAYLVAFLTPEDADATYQWYRGDADEWTAIDGATSRVYTQTEDDFGSYIKVVATGAGQYEGDVEVVTTKKTMKTVGAATLSGDAVVGSVLTLTLATEGAAENATYYWYRGDGETWSRIVDADSANYTLTDDDLGYYVKARAVGKTGFTSSSEATTDAAVAQAEANALLDVALTQIWDDDLAFDL